METHDFERRRLRVYITGPISSDPFEGAHNAMRWGKRMVADGLAPYVPHLDVFMFLTSPPEPVTWNAFLEWDLEWSTLAEAMFWLPGESKGAELELAVAAGLQVPVFEEPEYDLLLQYASMKGLLGKRR